MKVTQVTIGRFSQFNLARQLEKHGLLQEIWTGYPKFKLKNETGITPSKIKTFPWVQMPYMARGHFGLSNWKWLSEEWAWFAHESLDRFVASRLKNPTIVLGLSGSGLRCGKKAKSNGGRYICHRGSSHITYQNNLLVEEHQRYNIPYKGIDKRVIAKEEEEYETADIVVVPSEFSRLSFIEQGVDEKKIRKMVYGARTDRFSKLRDPRKDEFVVLWVGAASLRKGFLDAVNAFQLLKHPKKKFIVIGNVLPDMKELLRNEDLTGIEFVGSVPNEKLIDYYNDAHVFILSSIEDGFGVVIGEALACGCPVIATTNTGGRDFFTDGIEGFIVPIRSPQIIADRMEALAADPALRSRMSDAAANRVKQVGGWDSYGNEYAALIKELGAL